MYQWTYGLDRWKHVELYSVNFVILTQTKFCRRGSFGNCCWSTISVPCHIYICGQSILRFECLIAYMFSEKMIIILSLFLMLSPFFAVLDGIGKGLDPRFDITEIAKPWVLNSLLAFHTFIFLTKKHVKLAHLHLFCTLNRLNFFSSTFFLVLTWYIC